MKEDEDFLKEVESVGFDDDFEIDDISEEIDAGEPEIYEKEDLHAEFLEKNREVELELEKYYDDSVTIDELQTYLEGKVSQIYGAELEKYQLASAGEIVETFLEYKNFGRNDSNYSR